MPELPEVQTIVSDLKKKIIGRRITGFFSDTPRIFKYTTITKISGTIKNCKIAAVERRGKNILFHLSKGSRIKDQKLLLIHPKLTGRLEIVKADKQHKIWDKKKYFRAIFYLDNKTALGFSDLRKFGKIIFGDRQKVEFLPDLADLGPDPLERNFDLATFRNLIKREKRKIKQVLMDQKVIAGIGNIYSDETLWHAKIHPLKPSNQLTNHQSTNLYKAIRSVLKKSLRLRGSSWRNWRDTEGREGGYIKIRRVYGREALPCFRCATKIKRIKMGGRSAHFCPRCQKL